MAVRQSRGGLKRRRLGLPRHVPTKRFIPDGDVEFANKARCFAERILREPERFALSADDAERIDEAVVEFRDALAKARHRYTRSMQMTRLKDDAREKAEQIVRKYGTLIRLNENIPAADKITVGIRERSKRPRKTQCPTTAPYLRFVRSTGDENSCEPVHILTFREAIIAGGRARPDGAARLELFVELVPHDAPIPTHPAQLTGGWAKYLRSYTRSPIRVEFPVAPGPMRVVYWARWADSTGNVGPFCETVVARVEGWDNERRAVAQLGSGRKQQRIVITSAMKELPDQTEQAVEALCDLVGGLLPDPRG